MRCVDAAAERSAEAAEGDADDVVEDALEVVKEDGVRGAFEDKRQLLVKSAVGKPSSLLVLE